MFNYELVFQIFAVITSIWGFFSMWNLISLLNNPLITKVTIYWNFYIPYVYWIFYLGWIFR